jgi:tetratricopeptide (TPR) repeat protein
MRYYGRTICLVLLMSTGCVGEKISPETRQRLDAARADYDVRKYRDVVRYTSDILRTERGEGAMQAYYLRGMALYQLKEFAPAREDLQRVYDRTRNCDLRIKATDTLGELAYRRGDFQEADRLLLEVIEQTPEGERPADHARFRRGCLRQQQGKWIDADVEFEKVLYQFPGTPIAAKAQRRARGRSWTIQVGSYDGKSNAAAAAPKYRQAGFRTYIEPSMQDGNMKFLLQVGRWGQYKTAESELSAVRRIKSDAFLHVAR